MKRLFILILLILIAIPVASAKTGHLRLLAVREDGNSMEGSIADLYLEIEPGAGRVFADTFPLTKIDTQVSTRFAKEIACDYLDMDCDSYDFFYTIRADSPIIAGPSAGAAISALTISLLGSIDIDENVAVTGTINSGGIVGTVGGVKEKIDAAVEDGITKVLIPYGERYARDYTLDNLTLRDVIDNESNTTAGMKKIDLVEYGRERGISVVEVSDINDVMFGFSGRRISRTASNITRDKSYEKTMKRLAEELCDRGDSLESEMVDPLLENDTLYPLYDDAMNLSIKGRDTMSDGRYYAAASYCYGANVKLGTLIFMQKNETPDILMKRISSLETELEDFSIPAYRTITDLQAYMVVDERITDARNVIGIVKENMEADNLDAARANLAYAIERKFSAYSWSMFITGKGIELSLTGENMKRSCEKKISEAEERYQYVSLFFPAYIQDTRKGLDDAYDELQEGNYESCLYKAAKAKAETDVILSAFGVEDEYVDDLIERKLDIVEKYIVEQIGNSVFPIVGFSYYEYAKDLKDTDQYSSLLYSEYALEMSSLDLYFPEKKQFTVTDQDRNEVAIFFIGLGAGLLVGIMVMLRSRRK